ncbi:MAG: hypothetical protein LBD49_00560 [Oscillospiraceae bacterium]|nr:hypothetical protein [Oscillospiraceae bacterium]
MIAFCGDRGQGKSSAMLTYAKYLKAFSEKPSEYRAPGTNPRGASYCVLDRINPQQLEEHEDILTEVMSMMLQKLERKIERDNLSPDYYDEFLTLLRECVMLINSKKSKKDVVSERFEDEITGLLHRARSADLRSIFAELVHLFLLLFFGRKTDDNGAALVVPIDDVDLDVKRAYSVAQEIRKYLAVPRVVVLMAVKPEQLQWVVKQQYISECMDILKYDKEFDEHTIRDMAAKYMDKFLPDRRRVYLLDLSVSGTDITFEYLDGDGKTLLSAHDGVGYRKAVCDYVYRKTGVRFSHAEEHSSSIVPRNMRDLVEFMGFLHSMKDFQADAPGQGGADTGKKPDRAVWLSNLQRLEDYITNSYAPRHLRSVDLDTVKRIAKEPRFEKHEIAIRGLIKVSESIVADSDGFKLWRIASGEADRSVWQVASNAAYCESVLCNDYMYCLSFAVCALYTIEALRLLIAGERPAFDDYKAFVGKFDFKTTFAETSTNSNMVAEMFEDLFGERLVDAVRGNIENNVFSDSTLLLCNTNFVLELFRELQKEIKSLSDLAEEPGKLVDEIRCRAKKIAKDFAYPRDEKESGDHIFDRLFGDKAKASLEDIRKKAQKAKEQKAKEEGVSQAAKDEVEKKIKTQQSENVSGGTESPGGSRE